VRPFRRRLAGAGRCRPLQGRAGKRRGVHGTQRPRPPKTAKAFGGRSLTTADILGAADHRGPIELAWSPVAAHFPWGTGNSGTRSSQSINLEGLAPFLQLALQVIQRQV
jgi:hypothetical protein